MTEIKKHIGYVYKILTDNKNTIYVGSTKSIRNRKNNHKNGLKSNPQRPVYKKMIEMGITTENFCKRVDLVWIEDCLFNQRHELKAREKHWIQKLKPCGNIKIPYDVEKKEGDRLYQLNYVKKNGEKLKEYRKKYCEKNREKRKLYGKKFYEKNREKVKENSRNYYKKNKDRVLIRIKENNKRYYEERTDEMKIYLFDYHKKYREANKEKIRLYQQEYRAKNKKLAEQLKQDSIEKYRENNE